MSIENNKLIAEFMGMTVNENGICNPYPNVPGVWFQAHNFDVWSVGGHPYHTSWDWLMPVAAKAYNEGNQIEMDKKGDTETTYMRRDMGAFTARLIQGLLEFDIEICYKAVVGIITNINSIKEYYSQNKQS